MGVTKNRFACIFHRSRVLYPALESQRGPGAGSLCGHISGRLGVGMIWDKPRILQELRHLHRDGVDLSYNHVARKHQALLSAAAYHFGSYRTGIEKAGIDYSEVIQRPRWNKQRIIRLLKEAKRKGIELHWSSVT